MIYDEAMSILNDGHRVKRKSWSRYEWLILLPSVLDLTHFNTYRCFWMMGPMKKELYTVTNEDRNAIDWQVLIVIDGIKYISLPRNKSDNKILFLNLSDKKKKIIVDNWTQLK